MRAVDQRPSLADHRFRGTLLAPYKRSQRQQPGDISARRGARYFSVTNASRLRPIYWSTTPIVVGPVVPEVVQLPLEGTKLGSFVVHREDAFQRARIGYHNGPVLPADFVLLLLEHPCELPHEGRRGPTSTFDHGRSAGQPFLASPQRRLAFTRGGSLPATPSVDPRPPRS